MKGYRIIGEITFTSWERRGYGRKFQLGYAGRDVPTMMEGCDHPFAKTVIAFLYPGKQSQVWNGLVPTPRVVETVQKIRNFFKFII